MKKEQMKIYEKNDPKLQQRFQKLKPEQNINPNIKLKLQEFSPLMQLSTDTLIDNFKVTKKKYVNIRKII